MKNLWVMTSVETPGYCRIVPLGQKLNRTAETVSRECGTESVIGGGSGKLLGIRLVSHINVYLE